MAPAITYALPAMQLMCHLIVPQTPSLNIGNNPVYSTPGPILTKQTTVDPVVQQEILNIDDNQGLISTEPTTVKPLQSRTLPSDYVAHPHIGVAYKVSTDTGTFSTAKAGCEAENARLAVIDSFVKFEQLLNQSGSITNMYVGVIRMYDDTAWVNINTGANITALPWAPSEPNGSMDCVKTSSGPRGLRNYSCAGLREWACEIPIDGETFFSQEDTIAKITPR